MRTFAEGKGPFPSDGPAGARQGVGQTGGGTVNFVQPFSPVLDGAGGCVAEICREDQKTARGILLGGNAEQLANELHLPEHIGLCHHLTRPLLIMCIASIPCSVFQAVRNEPYPIASRALRFTVR